MKGKKKSIKKKASPGKISAQHVKRIATLNSKAWDINRPYPAKALEMAKNAFQAAETISNELEMARALKTIGTCQVWLGNHSEATTKLFEAVNIFLKIGKQAEASQTYYYIGANFNTLGNFENALKYYTESHALSVQCNHLLGIAEALNGQGTVYYSTGKYKQAIKHLTQAYDICKKIKDYSVRPRIIHGLGVSYSYIKQYDTAIKYLNECYRIVKKYEGHQQTEAYVLDSIGTTYFRIGNSKKALLFYFQCLELRKKLKLKLAESNTFFNIGRVYESSNDIEAALVYFRKSFDTASETSSSLWKYKSAEALYRLHEKNKNYKEALRYHKIFHQHFESDKSEIATKHLKSVQQEMKMEQMRSQTNLLEKKNTELQSIYNDVVLLSSIGKEITSCQRVEDLTKTIYQNLQGILEAYAFGIGVLNSKEQTLYFPGFYENHKVIHGGKCNLSENSRLASICFKNNKEIRIGDYENEIGQYYKKHKRPIIGARLSSIMYLPLSFNNKILGVITVQSKNKHAYTEFHLNLLRNLAVYVAIALDNISMYESLEEKIDERTRQLNSKTEEIVKTYENTRLLSKIGQQIISTLNFDDIFEKLQENVNRLMDATIFSIRIYNPDENSVEYKYTLEDGKLLPPVTVSMNDDDNYTVWCIKNKKDIFINDHAKEYKKYTKKIVVVIGDLPDSLIFCPMIIGKKVIGVISAQTFSKNAYTNYHLDILRTLASYTAIAIDNANLYNSLERKVEERTSEVVAKKEEIEKAYYNTSLLSQIGKDITSTLSIQEIMEKVYVNVNSLMDAPCFGIGILYQDEIRFNATIEKGKKLPPYAYKLTNTDRPAIQCFNNQRDIFINNFTKEFIKTKKVKDYKAKVGEDPESIIYVPLTVKDKKIGVITVQSFKPEAYTEYHLQMLKSMAVYTAIAIENASLYHTMEEQVRVRTNELEKNYNDTKLIAQITKDITSSLSVEKIIEKVYSNISNLMNSDSFGIGLYNTESHSIQFPGFIEKGKKMPFFEFSLKDKNRYATWCFENKSEIFINDTEVEYKNYIKSNMPPVAGEAPVSIIYLPLITNERIIGVLTVQSFTKYAYTEYHLHIIKNIALSVAIAIENASLYQHLEEKVIERTNEVVKQKEQLEMSLQSTHLLSKIGKEVLSTITIDGIIEKVYESVNSLMDAAAFGIGIFIPDKNLLFFPGVMENGRKLNDFSYNINEDRIAVRCFKNKEEIVINDWALEYKSYEPENYDALEGNMPDSIIYLPLVSNVKTVGVITVQSFKKNAYSEYHLNILRNLALYVGSAIENASVYENLEEKVKERTAEIEKAYANTKLLSHISRDISSSLSIESIISKVYENVNTLMDASCFGIGIYKKEMNAIHMPGFIENGVAMPDFSFYMNEDRLAVKCFKEEKLILINNYPEEYKLYINTTFAPVAGVDATSIIYLPLYSKEKVIGVITVQSFSANAYTDYHLDILKNIATAAGIAIENAMLYSNLEDRVNERTVEVVKQKEIIEEKNKHITDSILYAKRIQEAMLPNEQVIEEQFADYFVIYKPKDIVSGDFYWLEVVNDKTFFAVVDCTGHGVPGAFMSIVGHNSLNQAVYEYNIRKPSDILNYLNKSIKETFNQHKEQVIYDGMDIALCSYDKVNGNLEFSGAMNPLLLIRDGNPKKIAGNRMPIGAGFHSEENEFQNITIPVQANDLIYIFSDGIADQFGGPRGKKFKYAQLQEKLKEISMLPLAEQKVILENTIEKWRGDLEQVDDICVIGIKL